jgi:hypothetical protein
MNRKTMRIPRTKRIRRRMSGARKALSRDSNTNQTPSAGVSMVSGSSAEVSIASVSAASSSDGASVDA